MSYKSRQSEGFTLIEVAVTIAAFSLIMVSAFTLMARISTVGVNNESVARSQASARVAMDQVEGDLRAAGAEIEYARGQRRFVFAGPYQVAFNANLEPAIDPDGTGFPAAIRPGASGGSIPGVYAPTVAYDTGAETIVLTLDSDGDGRVTTADRTDDVEEDSSNPADFMLYRHSYGWDGSGNNLDSRSVALIRGPGANSDGEMPPPLFAYLIDHDDDRATPAILHGDSDGDGLISSGEQMNLTALTPPELARVDRVMISVSAETANPDGGYHENDGYRRVSMAGEVKVRQTPRTTAVVYGKVFKDQDSNGLMDVGEQTLSGVVIRASTGREARTGPDGGYVLVLPPGQVTISEVDPTGYSSTTNNDVALDLYAGAYQNVNFGDVSSSGMGKVFGRVFSDVDEDGIMNNGDPGLPGVKVYADTGEQTYSTTDGYYSFDVTVGNRVISEVDPEGFVSTTPNNVEVVIERADQTVEVNFGDSEAVETGTIKGYVYLDENQNQVRDPSEGGVPGAQIIVVGQSTESDNQGYYSLTVETGTHDVEEVDPPGYTSTTPNRVTGVQVDVDQAVTVNFGDIAEQDVSFDIIELADTERALSIGSGNLREDSRGDPDLVLGTRFSGGSNNLLVWHNERRNSRTPNSAIFSSNPNYTRPSMGDVVSLDLGQLDRDSAIDVITGLATETSPDLNAWLVDGGNMSDTPTQSYATEGGQVVTDVKLADMNGDQMLDMVAGVTRGSYAGHFEIWLGDGSGGFTRSNVIDNGAGPFGNALGAVTAIALEDISHDGQPDLVVASLDLTQKSSVHVYVNASSGYGDAYVGLMPIQKFDVFGKVNELAVVDMMEDTDGDLDILVATEQYETIGGVQLWLMHADWRFGMVTESGRTMDDWMETNGAPVSMGIAAVDNDIFPDILVGTRSGSYEGFVQLARTFGYMPGHAQDVTETSIGTVMTMTTNDFNLDNVMDLAVGTQNSSSYGKVFVFYQR